MSRTLVLGTVLWKVHVEASAAALGITPLARQLGARAKSCPAWSSTNSSGSEALHSNLALWRLAARLLAPPSQEEKWLSELKD